MAGLAGILGPENSALRPILETMVKSLSFSSKDKSEYWNDVFAGLCRVKIGKDNRQSQPIFSQTKTKCIVFFGECFGYQESKRRLIRDGHHFEFDDNDAEFVLRLYETIGEKAFPQLNGSYCFAIYDKVERAMLLVNDRLGTRPLFYGTTPRNELAFATQLASVLSVPGIARELDELAVLEFCTLQRVLGDKTYHLGVRLLSPGSVLRYRDGKTVIDQYWHPAYNTQPGSSSDYADELAETMRGVVKRITRGPGKTAMLLSGGLDARMTVAAANGQLICYTFGDYENPEVQTARRVAEAGQCEFRFLRRDPDHYVNVVEKAVEIGNGMHAFNHAHALGFVESIAEECNVVTHGFVPELLFRGYSLPKTQREILGIKFGSRLDPTLNKSNLSQRLYRRGYSLLGKGIEELFAPRVKDILDEALLKSAREVIAQANDYAPNVYDQFLWPDVYYHARYPSMLFELSLRHFMTERSLVFHNEVIDLHLKLPLHLRADKRLWLKAIERLNAKVAHTSDANTGHSPFLPTIAEFGIAAAKKLEQQLPLLWRIRDRANQSGDEFPNKRLSPISWPRFDWMVRNNPGLRDLIGNTLNDPEALPPEIFNADRVQALLQDHLQNRGQHRVILFALLTYGLWHKKYAAE